MDATQLDLFRQITLDYFAKLAPDEPPELEEPYLQLAGRESLDRVSLVRIRGFYDGALYLAAPNPVLHELLNLLGEDEVSERTLADVCREVSNVLSGNANRAFGGDWEISVPHSLGPGELEGTELPPSSFVMPVRWRGHRFLLVVALEPRDQPGRQQ